MDNLNTPEFWDTQFEEEYAAWKKGDWSVVRWLPGKFTNAIQFEWPITGRVLDIGCGLGHFCRYVRAWNPWLEVYGTDFSAFAIDKAREQDAYHYSSYQVAPCYDQPFEDATFDVVCAMDVVEHLSDVPAFVKELGRITKPGGSIILTTPERKKDGSKWSHEHVMEFSRNGLVNALRSICDHHAYLAAQIPVDPDTGRAELDPTMYYRGRRKDG